MIKQIVVLRKRGQLKSSRPTEKINISQTKRKIIDHHVDGYLSAECFIDYENSDLSIKRLQSLSFIGFSVHPSIYPLSQDLVTEVIGPEETLLHSYLVHLVLHFLHNSIFMTLTQPKII